MRRTISTSVVAICSLILLHCTDRTPSPPPAPPPPPPDISIYDTWWEPSYSEDYDADGYTSVRRLYFDVDADDGKTYSVYAVVEYSLSSGTTWRTYFTTNVFTISGTAQNDAYWVTVGSPNIELPRNSYDFRVLVYLASTNQLVASVDHTRDSDLAGQRFETQAQDPIEVSVFETYWFDTVDVDGDGYFRYGKLAVDIDAVDGVSSYTVYVKLYYKPSSASNYQLYYQTGVYRISGDAASDFIYVGVGAPNAELPRNAYDFLVEVYRSDTPDLQDWVGPDDEPEDLKQWFIEPASSDVR